MSTTQMRATIVGVSVLLGVVGCRPAERGARPVKAAETEVSVAEFAAEESKAVTPRYTCSRAPRPIIIDGDLTEWTGIGAITLEQSRHARSDEGRWEGPADLSGTARLCFDSEYLYLAFDTTDDVFSQRYPHIPGWAGDCVQFAFDPLEDRRRGRYAVDDQEFTAALTVEGPRLARWRGRSRGALESARLGMVRKAEGGGVRYEIAIPWNELEPLAPKLRKSFGFTFTLNDNDGKHVKSYLEWTPGIYRGKDPSSFGQVILDYSPPAAGKTELFVSSHVPKVPDVKALKFGICLTAAKDESLDVKLKLTSGEEPVADSDLNVPIAAGVNSREVTWEILELANGSYEGTVTVTPAQGEPVVRSFTYERLITPPIRDRMKALRENMAKLSGTRPKLYESCAPSLEYRLEVAEEWLGASQDVSRWRRTPELIAQTEDIVKSLTDGRDWFAAQRGSVCKAYRAPEDDSCQPYRIRVPADYDGSKPYPLVMLLHGYGGKSLTFDLWWELSVREPRTEPRPGYLEAVPYGRGNTGWQLLGRNDVFHVLDEVKKSYNVDEKHIYVEGFSMGGSGTWYIASRYPDRWAACSPRAGGLGLWTWKRYHSPGPVPDDWRTRLSVADANMFVLENLLNLPTVCYHGIDDATVGYENTEAAFQRLRELRYEAVLMAAVREGHSMPQALGNGAVDWMLTFEHDPAPRNVHYRTCDLRHNSAYWVDIDELVEDYRQSEVKGGWTEPGKVTLETKNISRLTLRLPDKFIGEATSVEMDINGSKVTLAEVPEEKELHLASADGGKTWRQADARHRAGLIKRHGLTGPMSEVLGGRFLVVYGTTGGEEATKVNRGLAEGFAERLKGVGWGQYWGNFTPRADTALSEADVASAHLILYGGPDSNAFVRRIADKLPVKLDDGKLTFRGTTYADASVGVQFIYPNPANPDRYVVVHWGASPGALRSITPSLGRKPDWMVFDGESAKRRAENTGTPFADAGFFDRDWK